MKTNFKFLFTLLITIGLALFSCDSDNFEEESTNPQKTDLNLRIVNNTKENLDSSIDYSKGDCARISGPRCVTPGETATFTVDCGNGAEQVFWQISGSGISSLLGPNGLGGTSQTFTFSSNFSGGITALCGSGFDCKTTIFPIACSNSTTCSIKGPNCGVSGDILNFSFSGENLVQPVIWSSNSSEIMLVNGQGTNNASFQLNSSFNGGIITATVSGSNSCTVTFPISDCCKQNRMTIDNTNRITIN